MESDEMLNELDCQNKHDPRQVKSASVVENLRHLAKAFAERGEFVKRRISVPTASPCSTPELEEEVVRPLSAKSFELEWMDTMDITYPQQLKKGPISDLFFKIRQRELGVFEPQAPFYICWLGVVSLAFVYNAVIIPLRAVFPYEEDHNRFWFFFADYFADAIYIVDIIWFKMRVKYVSNGQWIDDPKLTRKNYMSKNRFRVDLLALAPLDLFYLKYGMGNALLRILRVPRLLKIQSFWEFFNRVDAIAESPYFIRIIHTLIYKIYLIHLSTCAYYIMSWYEGFGTTPWTYDNEGNAYLRCFYFAFRTATSIGGRMPKPTNEYERLYMIFSWLMGVFVFAMLIGQIRDIFATATMNKTQYRRVLDQTVRYMRNLDLSDDLQKRVRLWLNYTWAHHKTLNENKILNQLPVKMRTDLSLSIHYEVLSKVELFKDCERTLLRELVLKFNSVLFLPGDYICKKGELGQEMYIINKGQVQVLANTSEQEVLATLSEGSVFGEVAVLGNPGFARRTADVRSVGYSNLFVLSKNDLWDALTNYPEFQKVLRRKAKKLMKERAGIHAVSDDDSSMIYEVESIIKEKPRTRTPKLVHTVLKVVSPDSRVGQVLSRSSSIVHSSLSVNAPSMSNGHLSPSSHRLSINSRQFRLGSNASSTMSGSCITLSDGPFSNVSGNRQFSLDDERRASNFSIPEHNKQMSLDEEGLVRTGLIDDIILNKVC